MQISRAALLKNSVSCNAAVLSLEVIGMWKIGKNIIPIDSVTGDCPSKCVQNALLRSGIETRIKRGDDVIRVVSTCGLLQRAQMVKAVRRELKPFRMTSVFHEYA